MTGPARKSVLMVVAHPDDETLWAGGTILRHPEWDLQVVSLCRGSDADRAPKFYKVAKILGFRGVMGDLDDGPTQAPLQKGAIPFALQKLLSDTHFDLIITHNPGGEYTRHRRHEEVGSTMLQLWKQEVLIAPEFWTFAYEDGGKAYLPRAIVHSSFYDELPKNIWQKKYRIITETYGFEYDSFEANTTPRAEAFWKLTHTQASYPWSTMAMNAI